MSRNFGQMLKDAKQDVGYWVEDAKISLAILLDKAIESKGITRTRLAEKVGVSKSQISQALNGQANLTIETMIKISHGAGFRLRFALDEVSADRPENHLYLNPTKVSYPGDKVTYFEEFKKKNRTQSRDNRFAEGVESAQSATA